MAEDLRKHALKIIDQHLELERRSRYIVALLDAEPAWDDLTQELGGLFDVMSDHFELEGKGGYMKDVAVKLPHRSRKLEELEAAHDRLSASLDRVRLECAARRDWKGVRDLFQAWCGDLMEHEDAENALAEEAFGTRAE